MHPHLTASTIERFWSHVDRSGPCWLWTGTLSRHGYARMAIQRAYVRRLFFVHRLSWQIAHGPVPDGLFVLHRCDVRHCVNPAHLFLGTKGDNNADRHRKGRDARGPRPNQSGDRHPLRLHPECASRGEHRPLAKLTEAKVREMRRRYAVGGTSYAELGREYGVCQATVGDVIRRKRWRHVR